MIEFSACHVVWAHQGGCCMFPLSSSDQEQSTLIHIWAHLSSDLQTCEIYRLGQLCLNAVVGRQENWSEREEASHAASTANPQKPYFSPDQKRSYLWPRI